MSKSTIDKVMLFQFTPLREGRLLALTCLPMAFYFNSRPSARGDRLGRRRRSDDAYFNSRPSARGDSRTPPKSLCTAGFQFTPLREGRQKRRLMRRMRRLFQFTPLREGRRILRW